MDWTVVVTLLVGLLVLLTGLGVCYVVGAKPDPNDSMDAWFD